jgi:hypothetical protein
MSNFWQCAEKSKRLHADIPTVNMSVDPFEPRLLTCTDHINHDVHPSDSFWLQELYLPTPRLPMFSFRKEDFLSGNHKGSTANASVLDYWVAHPHRIPPDTMDQISVDASIVFFGSYFLDVNKLVYVRLCRFYGNELIHGVRWVGSPFHKNDRALLLC